MPHSKFLALVICLPLIARAQSLGYMDADNPSQAVGMMKSTVAVSAATQKACVSRYPQLAAEMGSNFEIWKAANRTPIAKAEHYWALMQTKEPKLAEQIAYVESVALKNFEALAAAPGGAGAQVAAEYCKQHFVDLASGVWRTRTPRVYAYLDRAP